MALSSTALTEFLRSPGTVGSAFPASQRMVRRMLAPLDWTNIDVMVEYGPGTGHFTFAALERLKPAARLIAIEPGEDFVAELRTKSHDPRLKVIEGSASDILQIVSEQCVAQVDCILSGLPFSTLSGDEASDIMRVSSAVLGPGRIFAAYQMRTTIEPLLRQHFAQVRKSYEWWNIPPCHLYWANSPRAG